MEVVFKSLVCLFASATSTASIVILTFALAQVKMPIKILLAVVVASIAGSLLPLLIWLSSGYNTDFFTSLVFGTVTGAFSFLLSLATLALTAARPPAKRNIFIDEIDNQNSKSG